MTAATSTPTTAPPPTRPPAPPGLRPQLEPTRAGTGAVDGGWWPRSRDPDAELPGLIASLDASVGRITRVALNLDAHTIGVTRALQDRMTLLVVPPQATTAAAEIAMAMAADAANGAGPADILAAAGIGGEDPGPTSPQRRLSQRPAPCSRPDLRTAAGCSSAFGAYKSQVR
jgi:Family of unknown function (DUF5994)